MEAMLFNYCVKDEVVGVEVGRVVEVMLVGVCYLLFFIFGNGRIRDGFRWVNFKFYLY